MAHCLVSYQDVAGIRHEVEVEAESLYEAVACAVKRFRSEALILHPPGPASVLDVEVHPATKTRHTVRLGAVENFARNGTVKGPTDVLRKKRIRDWLEL